MIPIASLYEERSILYQYSYPTLAQIKMIIDKLTYANNIFIQLEINNNIIFIDEADDRWLVNFSGNTEHHFVNARLQDVTTVDTRNIVFSGQGQRVVYRELETVNRIQAEEATLSFLKHGDMVKIANAEWYIIDMVSSNG